MPCSVLHIVEQPDPRQYEHPDVGDVVGSLPHFYCAHCYPVRQLLPGEAMKCLASEDPCWRPGGWLRTDGG